MDQMQAELDAAGYEGQIEIMGVNGAAYASANDLAVAGRTLPWLQDTAEANVWASWDVTYRDVWILDGENRLVAVYNVSANNLAVAESYEALRTLLVEAAAP